MGRKIKSLNVRGRIVYILIFLVSLGVFWLTRSGQGWLDLGLNVVFDVAAMIFIICYFAGSARPAARLVSALDEASNTIRNRATASDPKTLWQELSKEKLFDYEPVAERWNAYVKQVKRQARQNPATADADVADYINDELLYSVIRKPFCDQIGGIMTGLGILFTFIGLVYGLRSFNATSVELMQTSTQILMAGIKVAFLTSIFGLIYSLIFGLFYKKMLRLALEAVWDFDDCVDEFVRPANGHAGENAMIRLQVEQNELLEKLADNIGQSVSESLSESIKPVIEELRSTLQGYVSVAIEDQRAGLDRVVSYFLDTMNSSMGNIFSQLREQTAELTQWQKTMTAAIAKLVEATGNAEGDLEKSRKYTELIIERVNAYTSNADTLTARQMDTLQQIESFMNDYQALHKAESAYISEMAASAKSAEEASQKNGESIERFRAMADGYSQSMEQKMAEALGSLTSQIAVMGEDWRADAETIRRQLDTAGEKLDSSADSLRMVADKNATDMTNASRQLTEALNGSFARFDENLTGLTSALSRVTEATQAASDSMKGLPATASSFDTEIGKANKSMKAELNNLLSAMTDTRKVLEKFNNAANRKLN